MKVSIVSLLAVSTALVLSPARVDAGGASQVEVTIGPDYAFGALPAARSSLDVYQGIGCQTIASPGQSFALCSAQDAEQQQAACHTYDANIIAAVNAIDSESLVQFGWDKNGECTYVVISTSSSTKP